MLPLCLLAGGKAATTSTAPGCQKTKRFTGGPLGAARCLSRAGKDFFSTIGLSCGRQIDCAVRIAAQTPLMADKFGVLYLNTGHPGLAFTTPGNALLRFRACALDTRTADGVLIRSSSQSPGMS